MTYITWYFKGK